MTDKVISVEGLGKSYLIQRRGQNQTYRTLRDDLNAAVAGWFGRHQTGQKLEKVAYWALRNISFDVAAGERIGIIGANGAGKSTLLKLLSRITAPTEGRLRLVGRVASLLEVGTGFHPELTGRENIYFNGALLGMSRTEIDTAFDAIVDFAAIESHLDVPVKRYSSGMYTRLAFSVAAHLEPDILIVDEVLAVGDVGFQRKCINRMREMQGSGRTVLFVSHNMSAISSLCNKAIVLHKGGIFLPMSSVDTALQTYSTLITDTEIVDLTARTDRRGAGRLKIESLHWYSDNPQDGQRIRTGQKLTLDIHLQRQAGTGIVPDVVVAISLVNESMHPVGAFYSLNTDGVFQINRDTAKIQLKIDNFTFAPGSYFVTIAILSQLSILEDYIESAAVLTCEFDDYYGNGTLPLAGHFCPLLPQHWQEVG